MATTILRCRNHADRAATIKCDECGRAYCRDCASERWITSRSSVWVCNRCAGTWRPSFAAAGRGGSFSGVSLGKYTPIGVVVAVVALVAAAQAGGLLGH